MYEWLPADGGELFFCLMYFALVMEFENRAALDEYLKNESYVVEGVWKKVEVEMMNVVLVNGEKRA